MIMPTVFEKHLRELRDDLPADGSQMFVLQGDNFGALFCKRLLWEKDMLLQLNGNDHKTDEPRTIYAAAHYMEERDGVHIWQLKNLAETQYHELKGE